MSSGDLFGSPESAQEAPQRAFVNAPLAARMRPRTLDEFVGQQHILGPGQLLRRAIVQEDEDAWAGIQHCFGALVCRWLHRHPKVDVACRLDSEESYIAQTFERFWLATTLKDAAVVAPTESELRGRAIYAAIAGAQLVARSRSDVSLYDSLIAGYRAAGLLPA